MTYKLIPIMWALIYFTENKYEGVIFGAIFTLREGSKIVGRGEVQNDETTKSGID